MNTLISFLGKSMLDPQKGYRTATYCFDDGYEEQSAYFGFSLNNYLRSDRFVVLGTQTSMWDVFFEGLDEADEAIHKRIDIIDKMKAKTLTEDDLAALEPLVARKLGMPEDAVKLRLIPYGEDEAEQVKVLNVMASFVQPKDTVSLDVTHGFRHLPMLSFLSALYLEKVKDATIGGIYYGALEMTQADKTLVLRLDGMLKIANWVSAFHAFDHSGDYALLVPPLLDSGFSEEEGATLAEAAFFERIQKDGKAKSKIMEVISKINTIPELSPAGLFQRELQDRLAWAREDGIYQRQAALAWRYFDRRDYLRAIIFGFEAFITKLTPSHSTDYKARESAKKAYESTDPKPDNFKDYRLLRNLRNALAHNVRKTDRDTRRIMESEKELRETLQALFKKLLK